MTSRHGAAKASLDRQVYEDVLSSHSCLHLCSFLESFYIEEMIEVVSKDNIGNLRKDCLESSRRIVVLTALPVGARPSLAASPPIS